MNPMGAVGSTYTQSFCFVESSARTSFSGKIGPVKSPHMLTPNQGLVPPEGAPGAPTA